MILDSGLLFSGHPEYSRRNGVLVSPCVATSCFADAGFERKCARSCARRLGLCGNPAVLSRRQPQACPRAVLRLAVRYAQHQSYLLPHQRQVSSVQIEAATSLFKPGLAN